MDRLKHILHLSFFLFLVFQRRGKLPRQIFLEPFYHGLPIVCLHCFPSLAGGQCPYSVSSGVVLLHKIPLGSSSDAPPPVMCSASSFLMPDWLADVSTLPNEVSEWCILTIHRNVSLLIPDWPMCSSVGS